MRQHGFSDAGVCMGLTPAAQAGRDSAFWHIDASEAAEAAPVGCQNCCCLPGSVLLRIRLKVTISAAVVLRAGKLLASGCAIACLHSCE